MRKKCPFCGKQCDAQGLKNHVRLCDDEDHGPAGSVPEGFGGPGGNEIVVTDPISQEPVPISEAFDSVITQLYDEVNTLSSRIEELEETDD